MFSLFSSTTQYLEFSQKELFSNKENEKSASKRLGRKYNLELAAIFRLSSKCLYFLTPL